MDQTEWDSKGQIHNRNEEKTSPGKVNMSRIGAIRNQDVSQ